MIWLNDPATTTVPQVSFYHRGSNARPVRARAPADRPWREADSTQLAVKEHSS